MSFLMVHRNALGQPIGNSLPNWQPPQLPARAPMIGRYCRLEPLDPERHAEALHSANSDDANGAMWTYLGYGPFADAADYRAWLDHASRSTDPLFFAIIDLDRHPSAAAGLAAYLRIDRANGVIEVGHLAYAPRLRNTRAATEAMYLMMAHAFALGYRRYEWKCDACNAPSRAAAGRLGFSYEGTFRQAVVVKGRNRDTAWFSILDLEWPVLRTAFETWLDPANFDLAGRQRASLSALTRPLAENRG